MITQKKIKINNNMAKKEKEVKQTPEQKEEAMVVAEVNTVLEKHGYAIRTFLAFKEEAVLPGVKLVKLPADEKKN